MTSSSAEGHDVALLIADLGGGGAQRVLVTIAGQWAARGIRVCVVTTSPPETDVFRLPDGVTRLVAEDPGVSPNPVVGVAANLRRVASIRSALRRAGAPVVMSFIAGTNVLAVLASVGAPWRLVVSERNDPARQSLGRAWNLLRWLLYRRADLVTANSRAALATLAAIVPEDRLALVENPVPRTPAADGPREPGLIVAVGRLTRQKGYDVLLEALARLGDRPFRVEVAGSGALAAPLAAQADSLGLGPRVRWLGQVADPAPLYARCGIFVLASRHEGTPNVVLEAMAAGAPVVVSSGAGGALDR
ncbi:MAG: glycosyltransferase, partial [Pseudomonadota bacterium]